MDFIKNWILIVVSTAVIGSIILILAPGGTTEKAVKTVVSLLLLLAFIVPFAGRKYSDYLLYEIKPENNETTVDAEKILTQLTATELENLVADILNRASVAYDEIKVTVSGNGNEIIIESITIFLPDDSNYNNQEVKKLLLEKIGYNVEVVVNND